jgi:nicotinamide-nucleotide amidase
MIDPDEVNADSLAVAEAISRGVRNRKQSVAVAESLTSGSVGCHLGAAEDSSEWFRGGVIAYTPDVKFSVLGVEPGPVVTAECAEQMARGVARLTGADISVALTGVGGPGPEEGKPAGTVFIAVWSGEDPLVEEHHFDGDPSQVVRRSTRAALAMLAAQLA